MHILLDVILFSLTMTLNADSDTLESLHLWQSDPRSSPACQHLLLSKYGITDHMYPPSNHRKSFCCCCLQSISPVQRKCTLLSTQTHTHTYKSQKWGLVTPRPGKDTRGHRSQRPWSNANWVSIFDWGLPPIVWCNHSDRYHFAMRFLIVVSGGLSKTIKDQNALNNAPLSLSKLSRCYKGAGLLTLLIFIMALKAHIPLWWRIVYLKHRRRYVFKRLFVVLLHMPWGKTKAVLRTVMGYGNTVMTFVDSAAQSKWMYFRLDQYKLIWTSTKRKKTKN